MIDPALVTLLDRRLDRDTHFEVRLRLLRGPWPAGAEPDEVLLALLPDTADVLMVRPEVPRELLVTVRDQLSLQPGFGGPGGGWPGPPSPDAPAERGLLDRLLRQLEGELRHATEVHEFWTVETQAMAQEPTFQWGFAYLIGDGRKATVLMGWEIGRILEDPHDLWPRDDVFRVLQRSAPPRIVPQPVPLNLRLAWEEGLCPRGPVPAAGLCNAPELRHSTLVFTPSIDAMATGTSPVANLDDLLLAYVQPDSRRRWKLVCGTLDGPSARPWLDLERCTVIGGAQDGDDLFVVLDGRGDPDDPPVLVNRRMPVRPICEPNHHISTDWVVLSPTLSTLLRQWHAA